MRIAPACPPTPPPLTVGLHLELVEHLRELQRLDGAVCQATLRKYSSTGRPLTVKLAGARLDVHARHRFAAAARAVELLCGGGRMELAYELNFSPVYPLSIFHGARGCRGRRTRGGFLNEGAPDFRTHSRGYSASG